MDLTDLQVELRSIEQRIAALHLEIDKMKPRTEEKKRADFEKITKLARKHPLMNSEISSIPEPDRRQLIGGLSGLLLADGGDNYEGLLYLSRLSRGWGIEFSAEDIYKEGIKFSSENAEKVCSVLQKYKYTYLVEAFVIAGLAEEERDEKFSMIADMAVLMGCDKEEVQVTAQVAKCRLMEKWELLKELPEPSRPRWLGKFGGYIPKEWIIGQRICCGRLQETIWKDVILYSSGQRVGRKKHPCVIKKRVETGSVVKKGDFILEYEEGNDVEESNNAILSMFLLGTKKNEPGVKKTITAPCNGVVFFIKDNRKSEIQEKVDEYLAVYVVSYFDEYKDFIKWYTELQAGREKE